MKMLEDYIRQAAIARGINPDIAIRVAKSEGGLKDPFRRGMGPAPRSQAPGMGATESSFGPFQLYVSGNNAGLGDRAVAAGIDPRKNWQGGIDYALDEAAKKGWGQWYGAAKAGIGNYDGIQGAKALGNYSQASPYANMPDGPKGQEVYAPPIDNTAVASIWGQGNTPGGIPNDVAGEFSSLVAEDEPNIWERLGAIGKALDDSIPQAPAAGGSYGGPGGSILAQVLNQPNQGDTLLQRRLGFLKRA